MLSPRQRERFDSILEKLIEQLPPHIQAMLEEVPLIVEDEPSDALLDEMDVDDETDLLGLHWGVALTHRSVEAPPAFPDRMMLFRGPVLRAAGHSLPRLEKQIRITLLHEIGHHFGLDEDDLARLEGWEPEEP
jgi:predicted Zn-dependent protease with MMP-like domain